MIEIQPNKTIIHSQKILDELKDEFNKKHCVVLDKLLAPSFSIITKKQLNDSDYIETKHQNSSGRHFGKEETLFSKNNFLAPTLSILLNGDTFIEAIKYITDTPNIQSFGGRIYKLHESKEGFLTWHDDQTSKEVRLVGFSLNLSPDIYEGGHFLIRNKKTKEVYREITYKDWGSAHLFRIDKALEHMVSKVEGKHPRVALGGWFYPEKGIKNFLTI